MMEVLIHSPAAYICSKPSTRSTNLEVEFRIWITSNSLGKSNYANLGKYCCEPHRRLTPGRRAYSGASSRARSPAERTRDERKNEVRSRTFSWKSSRYK